MSARTPVLKLWKELLSCIHLVSVAIASSTAFSGCFRVWILTWSCTTKHTKVVVKVTSVFENHPGARMILIMGELFVRL